MFMQCLSRSIQMAGVTLPAGVLTKPCCTSGIGGFVLGKHMGAMRSVMPAIRVCKNSHNRRVFVLQRRVWCCWKQLRLVLGLRGLHGKSPTEIFRSTSKEPGLGWRAGAGGCWRVLLRTVGRSCSCWQVLSCCLHRVGPHTRVPRASSGADEGFHWISLQEQLVLLLSDCQTQRSGGWRVKWDHPLWYLPPSRGQGAVCHLTSC